MEAPFSLPASGGHATVTSSGTANEQTITRPARVYGFFITVTTNGCYLTLDDSAPSPTNGLHIPPGTAPIFFPVVTNQINVVSDTNGNSVVAVMWVG